jgi:hypothetical protein
LLPGRHEIEVKIPWSNGLWEDVRFELNALPRQRYEIMRVELKPGQDPKTFESDLKARGWRDAGMMLMLPFAYVLHAPIVITAPIWLRSSKLAGRLNQPLNRPLAKDPSRIVALSGFKIPTLGKSLQAPHPQVKR